MAKSQKPVSWKMKPALRAQTDLLNKLQEMILQIAPRQDSLDREVWLKPDLAGGNQYRGFLFSVVDFRGKLPPEPTHAWRIYHNDPTIVVMEMADGEGVLTKLDLVESFFFSRNRKEQQELLIKFIREALWSMPLED